MIVYMHGSLQNGFIVPTINTHLEYVNYVFRTHGSNVVAVWLSAVTVLIMLLAEHDIPLYS